MEIVDHVQNRDSSILVQLALTAYTRTWNFPCMLGCLAAHINSCSLFLSVFPSGSFLYLQLYHMQVLNYSVNYSVTISKETFLDKLHPSLPSIYLAYAFLITLNAFRMCTYFSTIRSILLQPRCHLVTWPYTSLYKVRQLTTQNTGALHTARPVWL